MPPFPYVSSYFDMVDVSCEYGLKYIEGFNILDFETPDTEKAQRIKEYADSKGIGFSCFSVCINLVGCDKSEMLQKLKGYADVAAILGSPYLHHTIASEFINPEKVLPYKEEMFDYGISAVREIYDYCKSLGIQAIYEEQGYLFNGVAGFKRFLDTVDRDVGIVADFGNIYQVGEDIESFIKAFSGRIAHVHIKDVTIRKENDGNGLETLDGNYMYETALGKGIANIENGLKLLKNAGYTGFYGIEYSSPSNDPKEITSATNKLEEILKAKKEHAIE